MVRTMRNVTGIHCCIHHPTPPNDSSEAHPLAICSSPCTSYWLVSSGRTTKWFLSSLHRSDDSRVFNFISHIHSASPRHIAAIQREEATGIQ